MASRKARKAKRKPKLVDDTDKHESIKANYENLKQHRRLIPNLKFKEVPIVDIEVLGDGDRSVKTHNFIEKVSQFSQRADIVESGGFFIMRPKQSEKYRYLIDPQKIEHWNTAQHSDKHYFISSHSSECGERQPYNAQEWTYDIPQLSKLVDHKPLMVGSYPQKLCDVVAPLFSEQEHDKKQRTISMSKMFEYYRTHKNQKQCAKAEKNTEDIKCEQNRNQHRKRKRSEFEFDDCGLEQIRINNAAKKRKLINAGHGLLSLPKQLVVPPGDTSFDLTQHFKELSHTVSRPQPQKQQKRGKTAAAAFDPFIDAQHMIQQQMDDHELTSTDSADTGSHSFPTSNSSINDSNTNTTIRRRNTRHTKYAAPLHEDHDDDDDNDDDNDDGKDYIALSTNIYPVEIDYRCFDMSMLDKQDTEPPIMTLRDNLVENEQEEEQSRSHSKTEHDQRLQLPRLDLPSLTPTGSPSFRFGESAAVNTSSSSSSAHIDGAATTPLQTADDVHIDTEMKRLKQEMAGDDNDEQDNTNYNIDDMELRQFRGFAFVVNQSADSEVRIDEFWKADTFESELLNSPYDGASAEEVPLIFASNLLRSSNVTTANYGIIGNNITLYEQSSPLDLINLSLFGPFAEFEEGGDNDEYRDGVQSPYIYLGNTHTWFAWHREDMNLYAVNHLLWGSDKIWWCVRPADTRKVLEFVRMQYAEYCGDTTQCFTPLQHKQYWFDPMILLSYGIQVYFFRQKAGDIMITPPGGLHCGLNTGPNLAQSLNFMTFDAECWRTCLSAMHFALFNKCEHCRNCVWIDFHQLAERCRRSKKCDGKLKLNAPSIDVVPRIEYKKAVKKKKKSKTKHKKKKKKKKKKRATKQAKRESKSNSNAKSKRKRKEKPKEQNISNHVTRKIKHKLFRKKHYNIYDDNAFEYICNDTEHRLHDKQSEQESENEDSDGDEDKEPDEEEDDIDEEEKEEEPLPISSNICSLNEQQREFKQKHDPVQKMKGEKFWVYPVKSNQDKPGRRKYYYPALWISATYSIDELHFSILYEFKYLDSGTAKGRHPTEYVDQANVLWQQGMLLWDWNRTQKFKECHQRIMYPRKKGQMLLNYNNLVNGDFENMYYSIGVYYRRFPEEEKFKDAWKQRHISYRSQKEMLADIEKQHTYFAQPVNVTTDDDRDEDYQDDQDDIADDDFDIALRW